MKRLWTVTILTFLGCIFIGFTIGKNVTVSEQSKLYESLLGVASIVFGIMGAWVAIVYPDSLKKVFMRGKEISQLGGRIKRLFFPLRISLIVVSICLIYPWIVVVLKQILFFTTYVSYLRMASFGLGVFLVLMTLISLLFTFINIDDSEIEVSNMNRHLQSVERRSSRNKKSPPRA